MDYGGGLDKHLVSDDQPETSEAERVSHDSGVLMFAPWLEEAHKLKPHEEAAMLFEYAREGQELTSFNLTKRSKLCYRLRIKNQVILRYTAWLLLPLILFTYPVWTYKHNNYHDGDIYPSYQLSYLPVLASDLLGLLLISILWCGVGMELGYKLQTRNYYLTLFFAFVLSLETVQILISLIYQILRSHPRFNLSPFITLSILFVERKYENNIAYILSVLPKFSLLIGILMAMVAAYTLMGFQLFDPNSPEAVQYFPMFHTGFWNMLMVLNASNWPSPMIPALNDNRLSFFYFLFFVLIIDWGMLNLVLGFVYMFFRDEQVQISERYEKNKRDYLNRAFDLLDTKSKGYLEYSEMELLLKELYEFFIDKKATQEERHELVMQLDHKNAGKIVREVFQTIIETCDLSALKELRAKKKRFFRYLQASMLRNLSVSGRENSTNVRPLSLAAAASLADQVVDEDSEHKAISQASLYGKFDQSPHLLAYFTDRCHQHSMSIIRESVDQSSTMNYTFYESIWSNIALFIDTKTFDVSVDSILALLALIIFFIVTNEAIIILYTVICNTEAALKLLVKGRFKYVHTYRNLVDGIVSFLILAVLLVCGNISHIVAHNVSILWLILFRLLLWPRNILLLDMFKVYRQRRKLAFRAAFKASSHSLFLLLLIFIMLVVFASMGQLSLGGVIRKNDENIVNSTYGSSEYWPLNFNDIPSGIVTMFVLLHINNMHIVAEGLANGTGNYYFCEGFVYLWYILGVLLLLNILIALFLNQLVEYLEAIQNSDNRMVVVEGEKEKEKMENKVEGSCEEEAKLERTNTNASIVQVKNPLGSVKIDRLPDERFSLQRRPTRQSFSHFVEDIEEGDRVSSISNASRILDKKTVLSFPESLFANEMERERMRSRLGERGSEMGAGSSGGERDTIAIRSYRSSNSSGLAKKTEIKDKSLAARNPLHSNTTNTNVVRPDYQTSALTTLLNPPQANASQANPPENTNTETNPSPPNYKIKFTPLSDSYSYSHEREEEGKEEDREIEDEVHTEEPIYVDVEMHIQTTTKNANTSTLQAIDKLLKHAEVEDDMERARSITVHEENIRKHMLQLNIPNKPITNNIFNIMYGAAEEVTPVEKAAMLVQFARDGEENSVFTTKRAFYCYKLYNQLIYVFKIAALIYALLRCVERPYWTFFKDNWSDTHQYPNSGMPKLSVQLMAGIKFPLLLVLFTGLFLEYMYKESGKHIISSYTKNRVFRLMLMIYTTILLLILFSCFVTNFSQPQLVTITSEGAVLYILWFNRRSLNKFRLVLNILPRFVMFLTVFFLFVLLFAGFGPPIYELQNVGDDASDDDANNEYFNSFSNSIWAVFTAITSSSWPNQIMPSYREYRDVCIYFFTFITVGTYILLNVLLVIVLVEFQRAAQLLSDEQRTSRQVLLMRAFEVLDVECRGYIDYEVVKQLLDELYLHYNDFKRAGIPKGYAKNLLIDILDVDGDGKISMDDFLFLLDVVRIKLVVDVKLTFFEVYFPKAAQTEYYKHVKSIVESRSFDIIADCSAAFLLIMSLAINHKDVYRPTTSSIAFTILIAIIFNFEMHAKLIVKGYYKYKRSFRNIVDMFTTVSISICLVMGSVFGSLYQINTCTTLIKILLMIRFVLLPRNIRLFYDTNRRITKFARLLRRILAKITTLGIVFLCTGYWFAGLGEGIFGGVIDKYSDSKDLLTSKYAKNDFWVLNFNDFLSSCMTLFCNLRVSDFDVISSGFEAATSDWARVYFTCWYIVGTLLFLNILKSFFLGEFLLLFGKYSVGTIKRPLNNNLSTTPSDAQLDQVSSNGRGVSFSSSKNIINRHLKAQVIDRLKDGFDVSSSNNNSSNNTGEIPAPSPSESSFDKDRSLNNSLPDSMEASLFSRETFFVETKVNNNKAYKEEKKAEAGHMHRKDEQLARQNNLSPINVPILVSREGRHSRSHSLEYRGESSAGEHVEGHEEEQDEEEGEEEANANITIYASTASIKHSDAKEQRKLKKRLKQLAEKGFEPTLK